MSVTLGILAHVDAGKTTLSERILYHTKAIRTFGRVDDGTAFLDYSEIEKARGITVFSDAVRIEHSERTLTLIDTPGHADFSAEAERAISVMDYALLVVSATDGVQSHTESVWRLLRSYNVPTFIFVNKTDAVTADVPAVFLDIQTRLSKDAVDFSSDYSEALAEKDETLLEEFIENGSISISDTVRALVKNGKVFPCFFGSALRDVNIDVLLSGIMSLTTEKEDNAFFSASCYKIRRRGSSRLAYIKINAGTLYVKDSVKTPAGDRKIDEMYFPNGEKLVPAKCAQKGDICVVGGLSDVKTGDIIGEGASRTELYTAPVFSARVIYDKKYTSHDILGKLRILEDEENTLSVKYTESLDEIDIGVMGKISLQVTAFEFMRRFGIELSFDMPRVVFRETVKSPVTGYGHFEPLRHYAEVHLRINPSPRGSGISFRSELSGDVLSPDTQRLIRTHVFEKAHKGVLTGSEITDVEIVLVNGATHEKHTEGGDIREATYRAIRQGLMRAESILLEPMYSFTARSDMAMSGKIMADVRKMGGSFLPPETDGEIAITRGRAPARFIGGYADELVSASGGRASLSLVYDGYEPCRDAEGIIAELAYNPEADLENTPDSVFCAKGAGFTVKWCDAEKYMNLL
ncbi:MAG: TetM/TetW/TetO/TetS family tetracycline resistance ribosomal protection protein [Oscillospiraceae bacterium]|nr:TetM/TetW/TetO/TetS family tetracycline resistance ribosomal protection protein [Oscillospiraceae bacterium]